MDALLSEQLRSTFGLDHPIVVHVSDDDEPLRSRLDGVHAVMVGRGSDRWRTDPGPGGALLEHLVYDGQGQLVTSSLMDYALPIGRDVPPVEMVHLQIPTPLNPLGVKGLREGGAVGSPLLGAH